MDVKSISDRLYVMLRQNETQIEVLVAGTNIDEMLKCCEGHDIEGYKLFDLSSSDFDGELLRWIGPQYRLQLTTIISTIRQTIQRFSR